MQTKRAFTIIEVLVAVMIFAVGLLSAYILVNTANSLSLRSKQEIIAANLLRESLEHIKNIRDTNMLHFRKYDSLAGVRVCAGPIDCTMIDGWYTVENSYIPGSSPIRMETLISPPTIRKTWIVDESRKGLSTTTIRLCLDSIGRYTYQCGISGSTTTPYYRYIRIETSTTDPVIPPSALRVTAYVSTTEGGVREYTMTTLITDWKK